MKLKLLGEYIKILSGFAFKSKLFNEEGIGLPLIRVRDVNSGQSGMYYSGNYPNEYVINDGDILIGMDGNFNAIVWDHGTALLNQRVCKLIVDEIKLSKFYLLQYLPKALKSIHGKTTFTTVKHLSAKSIESIQIPLPPLDDQIRIATVLTRAEKLIAKRKESIKALDELLKSTFLEMFGDPLSMLTQPKTKLNKFIDFLTSGSRGWAQYYSETGDVFIRINNVRDACFKLDDIKFVMPPNNAEAVRTKVRTNDLLFSITADLGRTAVVNGMLNGAFINQHLALIRLKQEQINPIFVAWYFAMPFGKSLVMRKNKEGVKAGLNFDDIRGFEIVTPSLPLQNQFAATVSKIESLKSKYTKNLTDLENLYGSLSQRAFKGELDLSDIPVEAVELTGAARIKSKLSEPAITVTKKYSKTVLKNLIKTISNKCFSFDELWAELGQASFEEMPEYEIVKGQTYKMLEGSKPLLSQSFDKERKEMVLSVNK